MRLFSVRRVRQVGGCAYFAIPKIVLHEIGAAIGDQVELELDTTKRILIVRPLRNRVYVPLENKIEPEMLPFTLHEQRKQPIAADAEPNVDGEKVPA